MDTHFLITVANHSHFQHATIICEMMAEAAKVRGTGIALRQPEYLCKKMGEGKAVIALNGEIPIGFCYIENWEGQKYVSNSGLIVHPDYRKTGLAKSIKKAIFILSKEKFPDAKLFGITTSMAVMKINSDLGYQAVTFSQLTQDESFWKGCESCANYDILQRTKRTMCLCTGMVCDLKNIHPQRKAETTPSERWERFMTFMKFRKFRIQRKAKKFPILKKMTDHEE